MTAASLYQPIKASVDHIAWLAANATTTLKSNIIQAPTPATDTPLLVLKDSAGNVRHVVDHNGYPAGRRTEFREDWSTAQGGAITTSQTPYSSTRFNYVAAVNGSVTPNTMSSTYPCPSVGIGIGATAGAKSYVKTPTDPVYVRTNTMLVLEWEASGTGAASGTIYMGMMDTAPDTAVRYARVRNIGGNWLAETKDTATSATVIDTGVAPTVMGGAIGPQRFRVEYHGASTAYGAFAVRFFIDEVLVATSTTNIPVGAVSFMFGAIGSVATTVLIGHVYATWNRYLSLPTL